MKFRFKATWNSLYEASNCGQIRNVKSGRILKQNFNTYGYPMVTFSNGSHRETVVIHKAVAFGFVGPRPHGYEINHKDGNKKNNHVSNLEYVTASQNRRHAIMLGLAKAESNAKLTANDVKRIRKLLASGSLLREVASQFKISIANVSDIKRRNIWVNL